MAEGASQLLGGSRSRAFLPPPSMELPTAVAAKPAANEAMPGIDEDDEAFVVEPEDLKGMPADEFLAAPVLNSAQSVASARTWPTKWTLIMPPKLRSRSFRRSPPPKRRYGVPCPWPLPGADRRAEGEGGGAEGSHPATPLHPCEGLAPPGPLLVPISPFAGKLDEAVHARGANDEAADQDEYQIARDLDSGAFLPPIPIAMAEPRTQTSEQTEDVGALQKAEDFLRAFVLGFDVNVRLP